MRPRQDSLSITASPRALSAARMFGLRLESAAAPPAPDRDALRALRGIRAGQIALIVGPSGAGKSTLLRRFAERDAPVVDAARLRLGAGASVDCIASSMGARSGTGGAERAMRLMTLIGLGEARVFVSPCAALSEGQRARLRLGAAFARAQRRTHACGHPPVVVCDEFLASLDRFTACAVARGLSRLVRSGESGGARPALVVATSHDDLAGVLAPDIIIRLDLVGGAAVERPSGAEQRTKPPRIVVEPGTFADYARLAPLHYQGGRPMAITRILRARVVGLEEPAGVLVASMPPTCGRWRASGHGRSERHSAFSREALVALNRSTRRVSRVVVDPRCRGMGVASALVRAYLRGAPTRRTEGVAAMGAFCPFFERAGMTPVALGVREHDARLLDALRFVGVEPDALALPTGALLARALGPRRGGARGSRRRFLLRELRRWAGSSVATSARKREGLRALLALASVRVRLGGMAYVFNRGDRKRARRAARSTKRAARRDAPGRG